MTTQAQLVADVFACTACPLHRSRTIPVVSSGSLPSRLVLLGEAPGAAEDATGLPFCGASGKLLDRALADAGLDRASLFVVNAVKCRPPANRPPTTLEIATCRPFLDRQLTAAAPAPVVCLGASALRALSVPFDSLNAIRGRPLHVDGFIVFPTVHPAYVLRRRTSEYSRFVADLAAAAALGCS